MNLSNQQGGYIIYTIPGPPQYAPPIQLIQSPIISNIPIIQYNQPNNTQNNESKTPKIKRHKFSHEEDTELLRLVSIYGKNDWKKISDEMHKFKPSDQPNPIKRTLRQCKDRYVNYLSPDISHLDWTPEEDKFLMLQFLFLNKSWKKLKAKFPGRTEIELRNRFHHLQHGIMQEIRSDMGLNQMPAEHQRIIPTMASDKLDLPEDLQVNLDVSTLEGFKTSNLGKNNTPSFSEIASNPNIINDIISSEQIKEELARPEHQQRISALQTEEQFLASFFKNKAAFHQTEQDFQNLNEIMNDQDTIKNLF